MSRCLLHKSKLEEFKAFLDSEGLPHRPGKGQWQVLQVCKDGRHWNSIFIRNEMPEHFTTDRHLDSLVVKFCRKNKS
jgi:hypothetical protein